MSFVKGEECQIEITHLGIYGEGVGRLDGFTFFVEGVLPGEVAQVKISEVRKNFGRAVLIKLLKRSKDRTEPPCPVFGKCGGCQLMHLEYGAQLEAKRQRVVDALIRVGKYEKVEVLSCAPSALPLAYRNKIQLPVCHMLGKLELGLYARDTHDVVPIEKCYIHTEIGEAVFQKVRGILQQHQLTPDLITHVLIKSAVKSQEALVVLITKEKKSPLLKQLAEEILKECGCVRGVCQNYNPTTTNKVLSSDFSLLAGEMFITETICDLTFTVSPASFFQVNVFQAEHLYLTAIDSLALSGNERVLDAYCGVGTLSLILARTAKEVVGIEWVEEAVIDAKNNACVNGIANARFVCMDAEEGLKDVGPIDVAVLNPPRKGCSLPFIEQILKLSPQKIAYISCDPATLARDLALLKANYSLQKVQPFDMFPQTAHVETLALLCNTGRGSKIGFGLT